MDYYFVGIYHKLIKALILSYSLFCRPIWCWSSCQWLFRIGQRWWPRWIRRMPRSPWVWNNKRGPRWSYAANSARNGSHENLDSLSTSASTLRFEFHLFCPWQPIWLDEVWMCEDFFWFWSNRRKKSFIKVNWIQNEFMRTSFLPKCRPEFTRISALPYKQGS